MAARAPTEASGEIDTPEMPEGPFYGCYASLSNNTDFGARCFW
jgi:hypothetical protein